ncbi:MAG: hypothetical protein HKN76_18090, partial [Saprospiraceae bacterium]|nr:hypothetical protein [Saprospiraceae bacterium]
QNLVAEHYLQSIQFRDSLQQPLSDFQHILTERSEGMNSAWPGSVFGLLLARALDHFENAADFGSLPQAPFVMDEPDFFASREQFTSLDITTLDTSNYVYLATKIFQYGLKKQDLRLDLRRLNFIRLKSSIPSKNDLYVKGLNALKSQYEDDESLALIQYHLASFYHSELDDLRTAHELCQTTIKEYGRTQAADQCRNLKNSIERPHLNTQIEQVSIPGQQLLVNIDFRNLSNLFGRIIKVSEADLDRFSNLHPGSQLDFLTSAKVEQEVQVSLPTSEDFKQHHTETKLLPKSVGRYFLLLGSSRDFNAEQDLIVACQFDVSNLAFVHEQSRNFARLLCLSRSDGNPLSDVKVEWFAHKYDNKQRRRVSTLVMQSFSDAMGLAEVPSDRQSNHTVRLSMNGDTLHLQNHFLRTYIFTRDPQTTQEVHFYTDRALYRPGQVLRAKGIVFERGPDRKPVIDTNKPVVITLFDANGQAVASQEKVSNVYGSFDVQFPLPAQGLLGSMSLGSDLSNDRVYFRMEAYKRPTFQVKFDTLKETNKLGTLVEISGNVSSYAGAALGNTPFKYRVVRKARFPYHFYSYRFPQPSSPSQEIASGVAVTTSDGAFATSFVAIPDTEIDSGRNPVFDFQITIEVTDITGETQSEELNMSIGYHPYGLILKSDPLINLERERQLLFSARNPDGQSVAVEGSATLRLIKSTDTWKRTRYWNLPDLADPSLLVRWYEMPASGAANNDTVTIIRLPMVDTGDALMVDLTDAGIPEGKYQIVTSTTTSKGHASESTFEVDFIDPQGSYTPVNQLVSVTQDQSSYFVGDTAHMLVGSPVEGLVHYRIENESASQGLLTMRAGWQKIMIPIRENDRGDIFVHLLMLYQNRIEEKTIRVVVPWIDKKLSVELSTWRDLVRPGSKEEVGLKVLDDQGKGVQAEVLVNIFDASLDAIIPHSWQQHYFPVRSPMLQFFNGGFGSVYAIGYAYGREPEYITIPNDQFPNLNWFDFPLYGRVRTMRDMAFRSTKGEDAMPASAEMAELSQNKQGPNSSSLPEIRQDFNETLLFYPHLQSNSNGNVTFEYQMNDALTQWRMMILAHGKDASSGYREAMMISQKELMVTVNRPRFLRAGDMIRFGGKIDNLTPVNTKATARLILSNAITGEDLSHFCLDPLSKELEIPGNSSTAVFWPLRIPKEYNLPIEYTVSASTSQHEDAERALVPVLENRTLVTETRAITVKTGNEATIDLSELFEKENSVPSGDLILDLTLNPTWYAVKALPFLIDFPYDCSEQVYNRLYANVLGRYLIQQNPEIKKVLKLWNQETLSSPLTKNDFLKSATLTETPWVRTALSETEQMRNLASYLEENTLNDAIQRHLIELSQRQLPSGGFPWFPGGEAHWYITQYIVEGLLQMDRWMPPKDRETIENMLLKAIDFLDLQATRQYKNLSDQVLAKNANWDDDHLDPIIIQYLFVRGFTSKPIHNDLRPLFDYYLGQAENFWTHKPLYSQAYLAQIFHQREMMDQYEIIIKSLKERMIVNATLGTHWNYSQGFRWWELPIETHAKLIDLFVDHGDFQLVEELKLWLLNNKRTNRWNTTKSTSDAIRALLSGPSN